MPKLSSRLLRRVVISVIFLTAFFLFGYGTRQFTKVEPTCTDGIKNGQEEGVDCGLFACNNYCEPDLDPPQVVSSGLLEAGTRDYDFVAEIKNPHQDFGASEVLYELTLLNGETELLKKEGVFYILPAQTKFLILPFITTERNVSSIDFKIKSARWQKIDSLEGLNLIVRREVYTPGSSSTLEAVIFNDSDFDFDTVDIDVVARNSRGKIIAVNRSEINTFGSRTERSFRATWPFSIGDDIDQIDIIPTTNLFDNSNFLKRYGSEIEKFQEYFTSPRF